MTIPWALAIPVVIFLGIIVPIWITFHYVTVWLRMRAEKESRVNKDHELEVLHEASERMTSRLERLETILDQETPKWRDK